MGPWRSVNYFNCAAYKWSYLLTYLLDLWLCLIISWHSRDVWNAHCMTLSSCAVVCSIPRRCWAALPAINLTTSKCHRGNWNSSNSNRRLRHSRTLPSTSPVKRSVSPTWLLHLSVCLSVFVLSQLANSYFRSSIQTCRTNWHRLSTVTLGV